MDPPKTRPNVRGVNNLLKLSVYPVLQTVFLPVHYLNMQLVFPTFNKPAMYV